VKSAIDWENEKEEVARKRKLISVLIDYCFKGLNIDAFPEFFNCYL